ncbi:hypothetical protein [Acrocarpospora phusangensis]|nr:hypothetical protein [Acrocarpospora phusangensis]
MNFVEYNVGSGRQGGAPFVFLEVSGQLSGRIPAGRLLYPFGWSDPSTVDSTPEQNPGTGRYSWGRNHRILPDSDGCWYQPKRSIAYSRAHGLTFRHYYGLISENDLPCLERLFEADTRGDGFDGESVARCGVEFLGFITIPTERL